MTSDLEPLKARSAQQLKVEFASADRKREWVEWCAQRNLAPGRQLRDLAEREMAGVLQQPRESAFRATLKARADEGQKISTKVFLTPSEHAAVTAAAKSEGFGFPEWIIAAVRTALTEEPGHGQADLEALRQSNVNLAEVAVELAQWRRNEADDAVADKVRLLETEVREHVEKVSGLLAQGVRRWQIKR